MSIGSPEMYFCDTLEAFGSTVAVLDEHRQAITYSTLVETADQMAENFGPRHSLVLIHCDYTLQTLVAYLACLRHRRIALLIDSNLDAAYLQGLMACYRPEAIVDKNGEVSKHAGGEEPVRKDVAVMMSTSGSTGSPKMVMLSLANLHANASSINQYLPITSDERAISTLPFHYSYGLSIINTHLMAGARISVTADAIISRAFWERFKNEEITSLAGVPFVYEMLKRLRFERMELPALRYLTQAGGKLPGDLIVEFGKLAEMRQIPFYVMYGQTEATARISYVPADKLLQYPETIGIAIPDGEIYLRSLRNGSEVTAFDEEGELIYRGPNVMLGYARSRENLHDPAEALTELATGDIGRRNSEGLFTLTGRLNRFIKLYGQRVNLDELEARLRAGGHEVLCGGSDQALVIGCLDGTPEAVLKAWVHKHLAVHPGVVEVRRLSERPVTSSGKINYSAL